MGQLLIYGFNQLRRHPLIIFFSTTLPLSVAMFTFLCDIIFRQRTTSDFDPVALWHSMSIGHKLFVLGVIPFSTWIPFGIGQAALAHAIHAEQLGQPLRPVEVLQRTLRSALILVPTLIIVACVWAWANFFLFVPGILCAAATGFVPVA